NDALLFLMRDLLPNGLLGLAITGLLAAFMAGMAANISAFNTVFSYDLWADYIVKDREDDYYLRIGRIATVAATAVAIFTASLAGQGAAFLAASVAFVVDIALSIAVSLVTEPKPASELKGLVYSETPKEQRTDPNEASYPWYRRTVPLAGVALVMVIILNVLF